MKVPAPSPQAEAASLCDGLKLPSSVDGQKRRDTDPASPYVAAWGSPAIALRCGVPRPSGSDGLIGQVVEINGLQWMPEEGDRPATWTLVGRKAYVEITIPGKYTPEGRPAGDVLTEFTAPLSTLPVLPGKAF
ncbi:hypothetical protein GCM10010468_08070 [Actinocorallia longicatena]|uniref:DUF3515 domain-containing protein n=1 Tax=Actinocorallia longicatena TaxID=111803 RepID=A0ABP6PZC6_9ACTN